MVEECFVKASWVISLSTLNLRSPCTHCQELFSVLNLDGILMRKRATNKEVCNQLEILHKIYADVGWDTSVLFSRDCRF
jgi:hypothetical protein